MFVLFQGGILVIAHRSPRIRDPLYGDRLHLLQKVRNEKKQSNPTLVLMLGSSRTADGFDASRLEQRLEAGFGKPHLVFNYGMVGTGPLVELIYLQRLIKAGIKPNLLLIEVYPLFLTDDGPKPSKRVGSKRIDSNSMKLLSSAGMASQPMKSMPAIGKCCSIPFGNCDGNS